MGELDYSLKEVLSKLDTTVNTLSDTVNEFRLSVVNDYQKKVDCEACKTDLNNRINTANSWIFGVYGLVLAAAGVVIAIVVK